MSHELRTPLNSLLILAEQLADDPEHHMTETQLEYAAVILESGRDLLGLLNSVLDLAKVESGTATVELADVAVAQLHADLIREFDHVGRAKGVAFAVDIAPETPTNIVTDPQRVRQILKNLISNAFKFTENGDVRVEITTAQSGWSRDSSALVTAPAVIAFAVRDSGIGIDAHQQRRIFEAFAQGDGTTSRLYGGTGLGLSISRELVGLLGGEITLSSSPGVGSTFTVFLPLGQVATTTTEANGMPARERALSLVAANDRTVATGFLDSVGAGRNRLDEYPFLGQKVLVIDDDFRNVFALTALLERGGAEVVVAEGGAAALAVLEQTPDIGLVLTDIMMPGMDGYDTMRGIRALDKFTTVPIIAVTGKVVPGEWQRCIEAGANDYVPKPVDTAHLITAIGPWLSPVAKISDRPSAQ
jgi:two-component system chemotaxis sensor kinase CheA